MFVLPLLLVFYYASFLEILNKFEFTNKKLFLFIFMITAIQLALFIYSFRVTLEMNKNEKNIADTISSLPKGVMVYTFSIDGAIKAYYPEVKIFDILGQLIYREIIYVEKGINTMVLDFQLIANGTYFLNVIINGKEQSEKIIVQHN